MSKVVNPFLSLLHTHIHRERDRGREREESGEDIHCSFIILCPVISCLFKMSAKRPWSSWSMTKFVFFISWRLVSPDPHAAGRVRAAGGGESAALGEGAGAASGSRETHEARWVVSRSHTNTSMQWKKPIVRERACEERECPYKPLNGKHIAVWSRIWTPGIWIVVTTLTHQRHLLLR